MTHKTEPVSTPSTALTKERHADGRRLLKLREAAQGIADTLLAAGDRAAARDARVDVERLDEDLYDFWNDHGPALLAAWEQNEEYREFIVAHTLREQGVIDFDLHAETVERFKRASEQPHVLDVIRAALSEETPR